MCINIFINRGSIQIGSDSSASTFVSWLFSRLTISKTGIEIRVLRFFKWKRYYIDKDSITTIKRFDRTIPRKGLQLIHKKDDCPEFIVIWAPRPKKLARELQSFGYTVDDLI